MCWRPPFQGLFLASCEADGRHGGVPLLLWLEESEDETEKGPASPEPMHERKLMK
jgi:hypothetical protein